MIAPLGVWLYHARGLQKLNMNPRAFLRHTLRAILRFQAAYHPPNRQPENLFRRVCQHFRCVLARGVGDFLAAEHTGDFVYPRAVV